MHLSIAEAESVLAELPEGVVRHRFATSVALARAATPPDCRGIFAGDLRAGTVVLESCGPHLDRACCYGMVHADAVVHELAILDVRETPDVPGRTRVSAIVVNEEGHQAQYHSFSGMPVRIKV
jgi:hypothetical protein